jgi:glycosyltransferase involved in cell wall biosynthesis
MRILILLTGKKYDKGQLPSSRVWLGKDLQGNEHVFDYMELVNNLQTVHSIQSLLLKGEVFVRHILHRNNPWKLWQQCVQLKKFIHVNEINIVHQFWGGPAAFFMAKSRSNFPFVLSLLGSDLMGEYTLDGRQSLKGKALRMFSLAAAKCSTHIIVMSSGMKNSLAKATHYKVSVLPEGIDLQKFYPIHQTDARAYLGWHADERIVLFFNNGNRVKNAGFARNVFSKVQEAMPQARLIEVHGVAHNELIYYYNAADALLITSLHEGSNNSLKEAIACNCPVVSSSTGDAKERLAGIEPSIVIDGYNRQHYIEGLLHILKTKQRSNGWQFAAAISKESQAEKILQLYKKITFYK